MRLATLEGRAFWAVGSASKARSFELQLYRPVSLSSQASVILPASQLLAPEQT
ncbi:MAG TPA: hypothetical protein PK299_14010 [Anaerolineales bacterium]|nr:hypothetical protein [Anaerolineales bacterium]